LKLVPDSSWEPSSPSNSFPRHSLKKTGKMGSQQKPRRTSGNLHLWNAMTTSQSGSHWSIVLRLILIVENLQT